MEKYFKRKNGITLVALVVTIVVLLILAGVSINLVLGNNGIIAKAKEARDKSAQASQNDLIAMNELAQALEGSLSGNNGGSSSGEDEPTAKTLVEAYDAGELKIGDYVNYKPIAGKSYTSITNENGWADQTYTVDTNTTWRVLGKEDNHILLISGSPIKKNMNASSTNDWDKDPYLYMKGAYSYVNCETMLKNICAIYSNNYGTARSITIEDVNKARGVKVEGNTVYLESDANKTNIDKMGVLGNSYTYKSSDYTPESYINGKSKATAGQTVTATGYYYDITSMTGTKIGNTTLGSLLFDKTTDDGNYAKAYWLASPGVVANSGIAFFGPGLVDVYAATGYDCFDSSGRWRAHRCGVHPIITLKSNITTAEVKKLDNQNVTEDTWIGYSASWSANGSESNGEAGNH